MLKYTIRQYDPIIDKDFVMATWMRSYRNSGYARSIPSDLYWIGQRKRIEKILGREDTQIWIATDENERAVIYGYAVWGSGVIHYLYVKQQFRRCGIGKALLYPLIGQPILYTHKGNVIVEQLLKTDPDLNTFLYDPYILEN